jgi:hypothetical protein
LQGVKKLLNTDKTSKNVCGSGECLRNECKHIFRQKQISWKHGLVVNEVHNALTTHWKQIMIEKSG